MAALPDWAIPVQDDPAATTVDIKTDQVEPLAKASSIPDWAIPIENESTIERSKPIPVMSQGAPAWKHELAGIAKPFFEAIGAVGGAIVGSGATPVAGTLAGGGLGYAAGSNASDRFSEWLGIQEPMSFKKQMAKVPEDIITGAAYEAGGPVITKGIGFIAGWVPKSLKFLWTELALTEPAANRKAGNILKKMSSEGDIYAQNADEAEALNTTIGGPRYTRGQLTNDPQAVSFEAARGRTPGEQSSLLIQQRAEGQQAGRDYVSKVAGGGKVEDFVAGVDNYQTKLKQIVQGARDGVDALVSKMGTGKSTIDAGGEISNSIQKSKDITRLRAGELYDAIPDAPLKTNKIAQAIEELKADFDPTVEKASTFPMKIVGGVEKKITAETSGVTLFDFRGNEIKPDKALQDINFSDLRKLRTTIMAERRTANASGNGRLADRLNRMQDAVEETIDTMKDIEGGPGKLYEQASKFYREQYVDIFKKGSVKNVLAKDATGADKVRNSQVASRFFQPGPMGVEVAEDFLKAVGDDELARSAMRDAISHEAITKITKEGGEVATNKLNMFLKQYGPALKKYGLDGEFKDLKTAQSAVDSASETLSLFNHSAAARVLEAHPDKVVSEAFKGRDMVNPAKTASDLLELVKGNKAAEDGLKTSIVNHIVKSAEMNGVQMGENAALSQAAMKKSLSKYAPVLRTIYKDEPEKIKAMMNVRKHLEILARNERAPVSGSDTSSNMAYTASRLVGPALFQRYALNNALQVAGRVVGSIGDEGVQSLLNRAAIDPDLAYSLMALTSGKITSKRFDTSMKSHINAVALYAAMETNEELNKESQEQEQ